jgi:integrase
VARCGESTFRGYEAKWDKFKTWLRHKGISRAEEINAHVGCEYAMWLVKKIPVSATSYLGGARFVLKTVGVPDPFSTAILPRGKNAAPARQSFSDDELEAIAQAFLNPKLEVMDKQELELAHYLSLHTGLRREDVCLMEWKAIDFKSNVITVVPMKTARFNRKISIPIAAELEPYLHKAGSWRDESEFLLPNLAKRYRYNPCGISHDYQWLLQKIGIQTSIPRKGRKAQVLKSFHSLRHTFVSRLAEKGISPLVIQSMSGHSTMAMTERYSHIGIEAKRKALEGGNPVPPPEPMPLKQAPVESQDGANAKLEAIKVLLQGRKDNPLAFALLALLGDV